MKKAVLFLFFLSLSNGLWPLSGFGFQHSQPKEVPTFSNTDLAINWANMSLEVIRSSPFNSPTYSSRSLAYLGITMYECVVHSSPKHRSLAGQLNGLKALPQPEANQTYNWALVLNAGQAMMLYKLYPHTYRSTVIRIDSLQTAMTAAYSVSEKSEVVERSVQYGWMLANAIFEWSKTDGGYEGYSRNFNMAYTVPVGNGYWVSPVNGQSSSKFPLHPTWGANRPFISANESLPLPDLIAYSSDPKSAYYKQHEAVYKKNAALTEEEKAIAIWWADDPLFTAAPPGHSYNLATTTIKLAKPGLVKAAETYARVGMAVADAFINCWKCKYKYHRERPSTFINTVIKPGWKPFWPEPPFPAFSSGHSTQAAAAATVLTSMESSLS